MVHAPGPDTEDQTLATPSSTPGEEVDWGVGRRTAGEPPRDEGGLTGPCHRGGRSQNMICWFFSTKKVSQKIFSPRYVWGHQFLRKFNKTNDHKNL